MTCAAYLEKLELGVLVHGIVRCYQNGAISTEWKYLKTYKTEERYDTQLDREL